MATNDEGITAVVTAGVTAILRAIGGGRTAKRLFDERLSERPPSLMMMKKTKRRRRRRWWRSSVPNESRFPVRSPRLSVTFLFAEAGADRKANNRTPFFPLFFPFLSLSLSLSLSLYLFFSLTFFPEKSILRCV